jgi:hypothetical protein
MKNGLTQNSRERKGGNHQLGHDTCMGAILKNKWEIMCRKVAL